MQYEVPGLFSTKRRVDLVGGDWNMDFIFPYIGNVIIPIDFHIFQRGRPTTNQRLAIGAGGWRSVAGAQLCYVGSTEG